MSEPTTTDHRARPSGEGAPDWFRPWTPKPGDRVRVRVSLECRYCLDPRFTACYERALADDGRTATVYDVGHAECICQIEVDDGGPDHQGHDIWVAWDERREYDDPFLEGVPFDAHFAATELEPIDPLPAAREVRP